MAAEKIRRHTEGAQRRLARQGPGRADRDRLARARRARLHLREPQLRLRRAERHRRRARPSSASRATAGPGSPSPPPACCCCSARRSTGARSRWRSSSASSFVVGALIALSDGDDILGVIATNNWTKLIMGAAGAALILLSMMPRVGRRRGGAPVATRRDRDRDRELEEDPRTAASTASASRSATNGRAEHDDPRHARGSPLSQVGVDRALDLGARRLRAEAGQAPRRTGLRPTVRGRCRPGS